MRSIEDKEIASDSSIKFEFNKGNGVTRVGGGSSHNFHRTTLGKATPSKWDDAQKWLAGLSRGGAGDKNTSSRTKPRNSNADDTRLIAPVPPQHEIDYPTEEEAADHHQVLEKGEDAMPGPLSSLQFEVQTKNVDCEESYWRVNRPVESSNACVRPVSVRDMGTEMTPSASVEPSRTATPIRATTPVRSPTPSGASTPINCPHHQSICEPHHHQTKDGNRSQADSASRLGIGAVIGNENDAIREDDSRGGSCRDVRNISSSSELAGAKMNPLETRAMAWDEAERAKYMARYKREEVKIQAWESHEKRKAEMEMKKVEAKAERMKARAQEKYANKLASTRRIAEEKRANAESKLNEKAVKTSDKADYIRRTGHLPSTLCSKLHSFSFCW